MVRTYVKGKRLAISLYIDELTKKKKVAQGVKKVILLPVVKTGD